MHQRTMDRYAAVGGGFAGMHHEFLPQRTTLVVVVRQSMRSSDRLAATFAQPDPLDGQQRAGCERAEFGYRRGHARGGPNRDDHQRNVDVAAEERRPVTLTVCGAVYAQKDCATRESLPMQQVA